jgi:ABC-type proline/glycine betaine transport system permease subunit
MLIFEIYPLFYALSGFLMKLSDDFYDIKNNKLLAVITGLLCVLCISYLAVSSSDAACIFIGVLIGNLLAFKVDTANHILSLIILSTILFIFGVPSIGILTLLVCTAAAFMDEVGHEASWIEKRSDLVKSFFEYRFTLKIAVLIFSILGLLQIFVNLPQINGLQYFQPQTIIYFLLFDVLYEVAGSKFDAIYNGLHSIFRVLRKVD